MLPSLRLVLPRFLRSNFCMELNGGVGSLRSPYAATTSTTRPATTTTTAITNDQRPVKCARYTREA
eukprot:6335699-Prorocentrum_lima.AAC.1